MSEPVKPPPPDRAREPLSWKQISAILAIVIAAAVPIAMAFGVDVCGPLDAVGIELDACAPPAAPAPSPASDDAGVR